jgi:tetratricopeptide (TPR) repeat protein
VADNCEELQMNLGVVLKTLGRPKDMLQLFTNEMELARQAEDTIIANAMLANIGMAHGLLGDYQKQLEYSKQALEFSQEQQEAGNTDCLRMAANEGVYGNIGSAYFKLGQSTEALKWHKKDLENAQQIADIVGEGRATNNMGLSLLGLERHEEAMECFKRLVKISQQSSDLVFEGLAYINISTCLLAEDNLHDSVEYSRKALEIAQRTGDVTNEGLACFNLGRCLTAMEKVKRQPEAIARHKRSLEIIQQTTGDTDHMIMAYSGIVMSFLHLGEYQESMKNCKIWLELAQQTGNQDYVAAAMKLMTRIPRMIEDAQKALEYAEQALQAARQTHNIVHEGEAQSDIGSALKKLGRFEEAIEHYTYCLEIAQQTENFSMQGDTHYHISRVHQTFKKTVYINENEEHYELNDHLEQALDHQRQSHASYLLCYDADHEDVVDAREEVERLEHIKSLNDEMTRLLCESAKHDQELERINQCEIVERQLKELEAELREARCRECLMFLCCRKDPPVEPCPRELGSFKTESDEFSCNGCDTNILLDTQMLGCRSCDFDLCVRCFADWPVEITCPNSHTMQWSDFAEDGYEDGWECYGHDGDGEWCTDGKGFRFYCPDCQTDYCKACSWARAKNKEDGGVLLAARTGSEATCHVVL